MNNGRLLAAVLLIGAALPLPVLANGTPPVAPPAPSPVRFLSRIDLAQADQPSAKSTEDVRGSSQTKTTSPQPVGAFPHPELEGHKMIGIDR